jgi:hypothetical protein
MGLEHFLRRWVSHRLTNKLRQERVELSSQLFRVPESQQRVGFRDIVTGDESGFLPHYDHRQIWCRSADEVPTRVTHTIAAPETMLTVFFSINSTILINWLTPGEKIQQRPFCEKHSNRSPRSCTDGALQASEGR